MAKDDMLLLAYKILRYISGCGVTVTKGATIVTVSENAGITMDGVAYLNENGRMQQAARAAGRVFEIVLEGVLAAAAAHV